MDDEESLSNLRTDIAAKVEDYSAEFGCLQAELNDLAQLSTPPRASVQVHASFALLMRRCLPPQENVQPPPQVNSVSQLGNRQGQATRPQAGKGKLYASLGTQQTHPAL